MTFFVKSLAPERIGLVLMVNGKSTLYEEEGDPSHCKAWVLDPGREYQISGFQRTRARVKPFRVLSDEESAAVTYSANTGMIGFHIVKPGPPDSVVDVTPPKDDPGPGQAMNISLRGLKRAALVKAGHTRSLEVLQQEIQRHAHAPRRKRSAG